MKYYLSLLFTATIMFLTSCGETDPPEVTAVKETWENVKKATLEKDGALAAENFSVEMIGYYGELRDQALTADREALLQMPVMRRLAVLGMRLRLSTEELEAMSGKDLFVRALEEGWIKFHLQGDGLAELKVNDGHITALTTMGGKPTTLRVHFLEEDGEWRFDYTPNMAAAAGMLEQMGRSSELSEEEFAAQMIKNSTKLDLKESDWNPPAKASGDQPDEEEETS